MNNIELIINVYQCFFDGDLEGWAKFHTDDFELKQSGDFPHSGTFIGPIVAIEESFSKIPLTLPNLSIEPISFFRIRKCSTCSCSYDCRKLKGRNYAHVYD